MIRLVRFYNSDKKKILESLTRYIFESSIINIIILLPITDFIGAY